MSSSELLRLGIRIVSCGHCRSCSQYTRRGASRSCHLCNHPPPTPTHSINPTLPNRSARVRVHACFSQRGEVRTAAGPAAGDGAGSRWSDAAPAAPTCCSPPASRWTRSWRTAAARCPWKYWPRLSQVNATARDDRARLRLSDTHSLS